MKNFDMFGVMIDCSRNAVMNLDALKGFASIIAKMGYNTIMLYTEDTFEVDNQPFFGHLRGRYSKAELKEFDAYCCQLGIELIPCIQTLAHLNAIFKWHSEYDCIRDCEDILLVGEEKTYQLIEDMLCSVSECFTSKRIHIGMDEAGMVGLGRYLGRFGPCRRFDIINNHLHRVSAMCANHGLKPMIWSDMFCQLGLEMSDYYHEKEVTKPDTDIPDNISFVYWDYYSGEYDRYVKMIKTNKIFEKEVIFAGGMWTWKGFAPDNNYAHAIATPALKACMDCGIRNVFFTMWGDDGAECSKFAVLPSLFFNAEYAKGNTAPEAIKAKFNEIFDVPYDSFFLMDQLDLPGGEHFANASKYLLYNDVFCGMNDYRSTASDNEHYKALKEKLDVYTQSGEYAYVFRTTAKLADVLSHKADLGIRTRKAYLSHDFDALRGLAEAEYPLVIELLRDFYGAFKAQWLKENKPHGLDIQDIRIGGLIQRITTCREMLLAYCDGETVSIPELEEPVLKGDRGTNSWARVVTPNVISHII